MTESRQSVIGIAVLVLAAVVAWKLARWLVRRRAWMLLGLILLIGRL